MTERMASYDVIIPRVLMQVQPCPQFVVLDAVQQVAVDFFTRTEVWTDTMAETLFRGSRVVELTADRGVVVSRVLHLLLDGVRLEGGSDFHAERAGSGITVLFHAAHEDADHTVYAYCAFRPARTAAQVRTVIQQAKVATTAHQVEKVENHHMTRMIEVAIMEAEGQVTRQTGETPII